MIIKNEAIAALKAKNSALIEQNNLLSEQL